MANRHFKKWIWQFPLGLLLVSAGITVIVYSIQHRPGEEWKIWTAIAIVILDVGLAFLGSSLIHKIKSDLIRRERSRYSPPEIEEEI
jgi:membrane protease YdiL (CAAX protease family)